MSALSVHSKRRSSRALGLPRWRVRCEGVSIEDGRWTVAPEMLEISATDEADALAFAARLIACRIELPSWKPWLRQLSERLTAECVETAGARWSRLVSSRGSTGHRLRGPHERL